LKEASVTVFFLLLRDRGIPEATCIVVDVLLEDVAGFPAGNYCIARIDIEIEARLSATEKLLDGLQDLNTLEAAAPTRPHHS
jgi:hypothetical protein